MGPVYPAQLTETGQSLRLAAAVPNLCPPPPPFPKVWDLDTQHCSQTLAGYKAEVWSLDVDPAERRIVTGQRGDAREHVSLGLCTSSLLQVVNEADVIAGRRSGHTCFVYGCRVFFLSMWAVCTYAIQRDGAEAEDHDVPHANPHTLTILMCFLFGRVD